MQWLASLATPAASTRGVPTPTAKRRHGRVEELGPSDDVEGAVWGRGVAHASEASGLVLREGVEVSVEWVEVSEMGMVTTAKVGAGFG
ncbi:hypothetical protein ACVXZ4_08395 [Lacisediminihabitans sp. FW035]